VDESTRKALEEMQKEAAAEQAAADQVTEQAEAEETPMQRMQREALEEQAAADAAASATDSTTGSGMSMEEMQQAAVAEQSSSDQAARQTRQFRKVVNRFMFDMKTTGGKVVNYGTFLLIVASVSISMLNTIPEIHDVWGDRIVTVQILVLYVFLVEYLLRIYSANDRRKYVLGIYGIVDFLTVLPILFGGPGTAIIRLLRLFRIIKLAQYFPVLTTLLRSVSDATNMILAVLATIFAVSVFSGNLAYMFEPETFHNAFVGTWWSLVTMSTVGYGDLVPHSSAGMVLGGVLILVGICVVAMMTAVIAVRVGRMVNMTNICFGCDKPVSPEFKFCPYCGQDQSDDIDLFTDDE